jgi:hypothetical protein
MKIPGRILLLQVAAVSFLLSACSSAKKVVHSNYGALACAQAEYRGNAIELSYAATPTAADFLVRDISRPMAKQLKTVRTQAALTHLKTLSTKTNKVQSLNHVTVLKRSSGNKPILTPAEKNHRLAIMGFVFSLIGLAALFLSFAASLAFIPLFVSYLLLFLTLFGIAGLALSATALQRMKKSDDKKGKEFAQAGLIIGIVDCAILLLMILLVVLVFVLFLGFIE